MFCIRIVFPDFGGATINLSGSIDNTERTLIVNGDGTLNLSGTLTGGTVTETNGATLVGQGGTLDGVTLNSNLTVTDNHALHVVDGLTLNGTATLGNSTTGSGGYLDFQNTETLGGSGTVTFGSASAVNGLLLSNTGTTLTLGPNITVGGQTGFIGNDSHRGAVSVINQGIIAADASSSQLFLDSTWSSSGTLRAANGGQVFLVGTSSSNSGILNVGDNGTIYVNGSLSIRDSRIVSS